MHDGGSGARRTFQVIRPLITQRTVREEGVDIGNPRGHLEDEVNPLLVRHGLGRVEILPLLRVLGLLVDVRLHQIDRLADRHQRRYDADALGPVCARVLEVGLQVGQPLAHREAALHLLERVQHGGLEEREL